MLTKNIRYCGCKCFVICDGNCNKAWGINSRPNYGEDEDHDLVFINDADLSIAPKDPRTYEGGHAKPLNIDEFPNKWCVRECERSMTVDSLENYIDIYKKTKEFIRNFRESDEP